MPDCRKHTDKPDLSVGEVVDLVQYSAASGCTIRQKRFILGATLFTRVAGMLGDASMAASSKG